MGIFLGEHEDKETLGPCFEWAYDAMYCGILEFWNYNFTKWKGNYLKANWYEAIQCACYPLPSTFPSTLP